MLGHVSGIDPADIAGANNIINLLKERERAWKLDRSNVLGNLYYYCY